MLNFRIRAKNEGPGQLGDSKLTYCFFGLIFNLIIGELLDSVHISHMSRRLSQWLMMLIKTTSCPWHRFPVAG